MTKLEAIAFFMDMDECTYGGSEPIQMAIEALKREPCEDAVSRKAVRDVIFAECSGAKLDIDFAKVLLLQRAIKALPPVTPTQNWIPVSERLPKEKVFPCLASDKWGQMWIPVSVVTINNRCFDGKDFEFDVEKFFKGKEVTMRNGVKVRELPREIIAWMPLPEPYEEGEEV